MVRVVRLVALLGICSSACIPAINPYDPANDPQNQAKATIEGTIVFVRPAFTPEVMLEDLQNMRVDLVQDNEVVASARCEPEGALEYPLDCDGDEGTATFSLPELVPGSYHLGLVDRPTDLVGLENPLFVNLLAPGEVRDVGQLFLREPPADGEAGQASIGGRVNLQDVQGGARTVTLYKRTGTGAQPVAEVPTDASGNFAFSGLDNGTYGLLAELSGFTPDFRVGLDITGARTAQPPSIVLDEGSADGEALLLFPVTAVLEPNLSTEDNGAYYTAEDSVSLDVLAFTDASQLAMRVSTDPGFGDEDQGFLPYSAEVTVSLPDVQGAIPIYAQFQAQNPDHPEFVFTTGLFVAEVVRDTVPPQVIDIELLNLAPDDDGTHWLTTDGGAVGLNVLAVDDTSSVARAQLHIQADNGPGDSDVLAGADVDAPVGLAQLQLDGVATPGEGEKVFWVWLADQAGNAAEPVSVSVVVDVTAPTLGDAAQGILPFEVDNADAGGVLAGRSAQLSFFVPADVLVEDEPVSMRVGQDAIAQGTPWGPFVADQVVSVAGANGASFQFVAEVRDRAGNVLDVQTPVYTLDLTGTVSGRGLVDQEPADDPVHAGLVVRLFAPGALVGVDAALAETITDALGNYVFGQVPEGSGYLVTLEGAGLVSTEVGVGQVIAGETTTLGTARLAYARGNVNGVFRFEDKADDLSAHGGILVSAVLNGDVVDQTVTEPDGSYTFPVPGLPVTVGSDRYELRASYESYFTATETGIQVLQNQTTIVAEGTPGSGMPDPVLLKPISGDFILCNVGDDPCEQTPYTNQSTVQVRLQSDLDVTDIRLQARSAFTTGDVTPPYLTYTPGVPVTLDISGADGVVEVYVQVIQDGVTGPVLSASILLDTVAPEPASVTVESTQEDAVGAFTNLPEARVRLSASAGQGDVSPLGAASFAWAATAPATIPPGADVCAANAPCVIDLPGGAAALEQAHVVWGFVCDQAGNCSTAPLSATIVYDVTVPRTLHGVAASPTGASVIESGGNHYTTVAQYFIDLEVGTAADDALVPVLDALGAPVADVAAYRFLPVFVGQAVPPTGVDLSQVEFVDATAAGPGGTLANVVGPGLAGNDGSYRVFAQYRDYAGNVSASDNNPFYFDLVLDTSPPSVSVQVNAGAPYTTDPNVSLDITATPGDAPVTVWVSRDGGLFQTYDEVALTDPPGAVPFDLSTSSDYVGDGLYFVYARFFDAAGNDVDRTDSVTLDTTPPDTVPLTCSTCVIDGSAVLSASRSIVLELFAADALSGVSAIRTSIDGGAAVEQDFLLSHPVTLPDVDGPHTVAVSFVDGAGNVSAPEQLVVTLDRTAPTISAFSLDGGAAFTTDATVDVGVSATDASTMRLSNSATFTSAYSSFAASTLWTVATPSLDGSKEVFVEVRDAAGNVAATSATIVLDTSAPAGTVSIDGGAAATADTGPTVSLTFPNDTEAYALANGSIDCDAVTIATPLTVGTTALSVTHGLVAGDGTKTVTACFRDQAGNVGLASDDILLDTTAPSGTVAVEGGADYSNSPTVDVLMSASDDVEDVALSATLPDCATATGYQPYEPNKQYTFAVTDGPVTLYACLRDRVGLTYLMSDDIVLDSQAPSSSLAINSGDGFTPSRSVNLSITAPADTTQMALIDGATLDCGTATYGAYSTTLEWLLPTGDGTKSVTACLKDGSGLTASATDSIVLDTTAPAGSVTLASGNGFTQTTNVNVALAFPGDTDGYAFGDGILDCNAVTYTTVTVGATSATFSHALPSGDGTKTTTACFRDRAGNVALASDDIVLDTQAPAGTVVINDDDDFTTTAGVTLSFSASTDVSQVAFDEVPFVDCDSASYAPYSASEPFTFTGADGVKTIYVCLRDGAGFSVSATDSITLDRAAPSPTVTINSGDSHTTSRTVTIDVAADSDVTELAVANGASLDCGTATYSPFSGSQNWTLPTPDGTKSIAVCVRDGAGQEGSDSTSIVLDTSPPSGVLTLASGAPTTQSANITAALTFPNDTNGYAAANDGLDCATATYTAVTVGTTSASGPFSLSTGDGLKTVAACIRDVAGNTASAFDSILLDTTNPVGTVVINGGDLATDDANITVSLTASGDVALVALGQGALNCSTATYEAMEASKLFSLSGPDGPKVVTACFRDASGRMGTANDGVVLDTTPPTIGAFTIDQNATHTTTLSVVLDLVASDATAGIQGVRAANDSCANLTGPLNPYASPQPWSMSAGADGTRTVCIEVTDYAGNSSTQTDTITIDRDNPDGSLSLNSDATYTTSTTVSVSGTADEQVEFALGAESIDCSSASYSGIFSTNISGTATLFNLDGDRSIFACLRDRAGNVGVISDDITLDTALPSALLTVDGGAQYTTDRTVDVAFSGAAADVVDMYVTGTTIPNCLTLLEAQWQSYSASTTTTLLNLDGQREVHACLRDSAGNISPAGPAYIVLDQVAPVAPTVLFGVVNTPGTASTNGDGTTIDNGNTTNDPRPRFDWIGGSDATSGVAGFRMQFSTSSGFSFIDYESDLWPAGGILPPAELTDGTWYWRVKIIDNAGRETLSASESFTVDTSAPENPNLFPIATPQNSNVAVDWIDGGGGNGTFEIKLEDPSGLIVWQDMTTDSQYVLFAGPHMNSPSAAAGDLYTFSVRAFDDLGQTSPWTIDTFTFDDVAPCESGVSIVINGGQAFTSENDVIADITCNGDTPVNMQVDCNGTSPQTKPIVPYQPTFSCSLDILSQGTKRVDSQVRDAAGNIRVMNSDAIIFDNIAPIPPVVSPANSVGVNSECAQIDVPAGSTLDTNFLRYEQRNNGGPWINAPVSGGKIQYTLEQDTDNLLEVRAVDSAGNQGEASVAFVNETSSSVIPTNLTVKHLCDNGRFAILKDDSIWPPAFGLPDSISSNPSEIEPLSFPDIYLLDLTSLSYVRLSGAGGVAQTVAQTVNFLDPPRFDNMLDAACTLDDDRIVMSYVEPLASPSYDNGGQVYTVVWDDPLDNPYGGLSAVQGPWTLNAGGNVGYAINSIDTLRWTSPTSPNWEALSVSNYFAVLLPGEIINRIFFNGTPNVLDGGAQSFIESSINGFETRRFIGLAFSGTSSVYLRRETGSWDVVRTTGYYTPGTLFGGLSYPDSEGFSATVSPFGSLVKRDVFESYSTIYQPYQMYAAARSTGEVRAYAAFTTGSVQIAPASYGYATYYQRGYRTVAWQHETLDNVFELTDTYAADPDTLLPAFRQNYQYPGDDRRPVLATGDLTAGAPAVLYHTTDAASIQGVVIGYRDNAGCFND